MSVSCSPETLRDLTQPNTSLNSKISRTNSFSNASLGQSNKSIWAQSNRSNNANISQSSILSDSNRNLMSVSCHPDLMKSNQNGFKSTENDYSSRSSNFIQRNQSLSSCSDSNSTSTHTLVSVMSPQNNNNHNNNNNRETTSTKATPTNSTCTLQCPDSPMSSCSTHTLTNEEDRQSKVWVNSSETPMPMPPATILSIPNSPVFINKFKSGTTSEPRPPPVPPRRTPSPKRDRGMDLMSKSCSLISRLVPHKKQSKGESSPRNSSPLSHKFEQIINIPPSSSPKLFHKSEKCVNVPASFVLGPNSKHSRSSSPSWSLGQSSNLSRTPPVPPPRNSSPSSLKSELKLDLISIASANETVGPQITFRTCHDGCK